MAFIAVRIKELRNLELSSLRGANFIRIDDTNEWVFIRVEVILICN